MKNPTLSLIDDLKVPQMGFGTYGLGRHATEAVTHALKIGYRHIDTADIYGSHKNAGEAIPLAKVKRKDVFITTKLWSQDVPGPRVEGAVDRFLFQLDTDYIDLLLIHWPSSSVPAAESLAAMDKVRKAGKVRAIGVSNFNARLMVDVIETGLPVCNDQVEYNLNHQPKDVLEFCQKNKVTVTAYSPLETGDANAEKALKEIAKSHKCSREEVLLAWLMQKGMIVIPRSAKKAHIETNFRSVELKLSQAELETLDNV